jgi:hypothetical protein
MYEVKLPKILQPFACPDLVRLGKNHDGGYLVNSQDIVETRRMVVFGLGEDWSFEQDFVNRNNCGLDVYDQSVKPHLLSAHMSAKYFDFFSEDRRHYSQNIGRNFDCITPQQALSTVDQVFLKCDIEGHEYGIIDDLIRLSPKLSGLVMEFHDLTQSNHFDLMANFLAKSSLRLVHIHVNNYTYIKTEHQVYPTVIELTLTSSTNISWHDHCDLPHELDQCNNPLDREFKIIF